MVAVSSYNLFVCAYKDCDWCMLARCQW